MKKIIFLLFALAVLSVNAQTQGSMDRVYFSQLKCGLGYFLDNTLFFNWEKQLQNNNGLLLGAGPLYSENSNIRKSGFRAELQYKLYITKKESGNGVSRIYVAPFMVYKYIEKENLYYNPNYNYPVNYFHSFCPGIIAGVNIVSYKRLVFDIYVGGGMKRTFDGDFVGKIDYDNYNIFQPGYNGVIPRVGFDIGITF